MAEPINDLSFAYFRSILKLDLIMRKRFEQQLEIGVKPILETPVLFKSRDDIPDLIERIPQGIASEILVFNKLVFFGK